MTEEERRAEMSSVVTKYLDALISQDGASIPLAAECWRSEQGKCAAKPAEGIRKSSTDPIMDGNSAYRDLRTWIDGDDVIAFYLLDISNSTVHIAERFRVIDGLIHEIEALYYLNPAQHQSRWPIDETQIWTQENTLDYISPVNLD